MMSKFEICNIRLQLQIQIILNPPLHQIMEAHRNTKLIKLKKLTVVTSIVFIGREKMQQVLYGS
jgi:hypothetical protein